MMFLFTTSEKIGSVAIRWALGEPCSHFAVVFDESESGYGIVFHSTLKGGVAFDWFRDFYDHQKIVFALKPKHPSLFKEEEIYQSLVKKYYGNGYDIGAFAAFSYYALRRKLSGRQIPSMAQFASNRSLLCTEIAQGLKEAAPDLVPFLPPGLVSPFGLYNVMTQSKELERVPWIGKK